MRIPPQAMKVFAGKLFDVYQWEQTLYNGSHTTFEMLARKPSVDIIATIDSKIIVLMQEQPKKPLFPSLPGGRVEADETPEHAAHRELSEETGYVTKHLRLVATFEGTSKLYFPEHVFVARACEKVTEPQLDGGEKITVKLVDFDSFLQLCRDERFTAPLGLKFMMYEALLDPAKKESLRQQLFLH